MIGAQAVNATSGPLDPGMIIRNQVEKAARVGNLSNKPGRRRSGRKHAHDVFDEREVRDHAKGPDDIGPGLHVN